MLSKSSDRIFKSWLAELYNISKFCVVGAPLSPNLIPPQSSVVLEIKTRGGVPSSAPSICNLVFGEIVPIPIFPDVSIHIADVFNSSISKLNNLSVVILFDRVCALNRKLLVSPPPLSRFNFNNASSDTPIISNSVFPTDAFWNKTSPFTSNAFVVEVILIPTLPNTVKLLSTFTFELSSNVIILLSPFRIFRSEFCV